MSPGEILTNYKELLPCLEVFKSNTSCAICRFTEVYSLCSSLCLDRCTWYNKCHGSCLYYCKNFLAVESFRPFASRTDQGQNFESFRRAWKFNEPAAGIHKNAEVSSGGFVAFVVKMDM